MKRNIIGIFVLAACLCLCVSTLHAAEKIDRPKVTLTGFWSYKFTTLNGQFCVLDGGGTRLLIRRTWYAGIFGYRSIDGPKVAGDYYLQMAYGGLWGGYVFNSDSLVHFSAEMAFAPGMAGYRDKASQTDYLSGIFILEPEAYVTLNLTEFLRFSTGLSYRFVFGIDGVPGIDSGDISGPAVTLQLRLGGF